MVLGVGEEERDDGAEEEDMNDAVEENAAVAADAAEETDRWYTPSRRSTGHNERR